MQTRRRVCFVITARPSYARVKTVVEAAVQRSDLDVMVVGSASFLSNRYGAAVNVMRSEGLPVQWEISSLMEDDSPTGAPKTTAIQLAELATAFSNLRPDVVVTVADRYETMATAIAASYMNIPVAHLQGGEVTGNIDEKVRHAVTKMADLHFVSNEDALQRVLRLGEDPARTFNTGCPSVDLAAVAKARFGADGFNPFEHFTGVGQPFDITKPYIVVMQHPVTTHFATSRAEMTETLEAVVGSGLQAAWFWPNPDTGSGGAAEAIRSYREHHAMPGIAFFKNMEPENFLRLLIGSKGLVGNSSVGIRECAYLGIPVVNIGNRQDRRLRAENVVDVSESRHEILQAIKRQAGVGRYPSSTIYGDGKAGVRIAKLIASVPLSYTKKITY